MWLASLANNNIKIYFLKESYSRYFSAFEVHRKDSYMPCEALAHNHKFELTKTTTTDVAGEKVAFGLTKTTTTDADGEKVVFGLTKTTTTDADGEKVVFGLTKTTTTDAAGEKVAFGLTKTTTTETECNCCKIIQA